MVIQPLDPAFFRAFYFEIRAHLGVGRWVHEIINSAPQKAGSRGWTTALRLNDNHRSGWGACASRYM